MCAELTHERVEILPRQQTFAELGNAVADWGAKQHPSVPTFVMIDPYGVCVRELRALSGEAA